MVKIVINGKEINFMRVLHLSAEGDNFVIYGDSEDGYQEDHILFFKDSDIDEIVIGSCK